MKLQFDANHQSQIGAVAAVADLFDGPTVRQAARSAPFHFRSLQKPASPSAELLEDRTLVGRIMYGGNARKLLH